MEFLGHVVSSKGISPRPSLLKTIVDVAMPGDCDKLRAFVGMCEVYAKYIKNSASIAEALLCLLKKNSKFVWGIEQQCAFEEIKRELSNAPLLSPFSPGKKLWMLAM